MSAYVFIDSRVQGLEYLLVDLAADAQVVILDPSRDGIAQIAGALGDISHLDSIHLVSHGASGTLYLGATILNEENIADYEAQLSRIGASLSEDGDILLYGCNVAAGPKGLDFVQRFATFSRADVAASTDATGSGRLGGDWTLEQFVGGIESELIITGIAKSGYGFTLDSISGTAGPDSLVGTASADTLTGFGGDDTLLGGGGGDTLYAGNTDSLGDEGTHNLLQGEAGNDSLIGANGDDTLLGGDGHDFLNAGGGSAGAGTHNLLQGGAGNDQLVGADGSDTLQGGLNDDLLDGQGGNDLLQGNEGNDTLFDYWTGDDVYEGGAGNDSIRGEGPGLDVLNGGSGADWFTFSHDVNTFLDPGGVVTDFNRAEGDQIYVGSLHQFSLVFRGEITGFVYASGASLPGQDFGSAVTQMWWARADGGSKTLLITDINNNFQLDGPDMVIEFTGTSFGSHTQAPAVADFTASPFDVIVGTPGDDSIVGTGGRDTIYGIAGNDTLSGGLAPDTLAGQEADDLLLGGGGADSLTGGVGNDTLLGGSEDDWLYAGDAYTGFSDIGTNNLLQGDGGYDTLMGADGNDTVEHANATGSVTAELWKGTASNDGQGYADTLVGVENLTGGPFDDLLVGDEGANILNGAGGNDTLVGGGGADSLVGAHFNDVLRGGAGNDTLDGGPGIDTLDYSTTGSAVTVEVWLGTVSADGDGGADTLVGIENVFGTQSNDLLVGTDDANSLFGNTGNDSILGGGGNDSLLGQGGNDTLGGNAGNDTIDGGDGIDTLDYSLVTNGVTVEVWLGTVSNDGNGGADTLVGIENVFGTQAGDLLVGTEDANSLFGNTGNDSILGGGGNDSLLGEGGNDTLGGNAGNDTIDGGDGIDTVDYSLVTNGVTVEVWLGTVSNDGNGGADTLVGIENVFGTQSNDLLVGTEDANTLFGNTGNDSILGGGGNDSLLGEGGNDTLSGNAGNDTIDGGEGIDTLDYSLVVNGVTVELWLGTVGNDGQGGADTIVGIENAFGTQANDTLVGTEDANALFGNSGNDSILGGGGADSLLGEGGNDTLLGGTGNDTVSGGAGQDEFMFEQALNAATNVDQITDFSVADDTILLYSGVFTSFAPGSLSAAAFTDGFLVYSSGSLSYDADGTAGAGAAVQFATLIGAPALGEADFLII